MTDIAVAVDLRSRFGPARNQGPRPTCLAFAASDTHACLRAGWSPLSCEYAFYRAQTRAGRSPRQGARLLSMLDALRLDGQPEESDWPYLPATPADVASWLPPMTIDILFGRDGLSVAPTLNDVVGELDQGWPVIILLMLSRAFFAPGPAGIIHPASNEVPEPERRHAVIAVGHGKIEQQRAILVRNSWGGLWGAGGYGWLTEPFLKPRIFAAAKLTEEMDVPADTVAA